MSDKIIKVRIYCGKINFDNISNWRAYSQYFGNIDGVHIDYNESNDYCFDIDINYDIIIFIRPIVGYVEYVKKIKELGKKIIIDFDDPFPMTFYDNWIINHIKESIEIIDVCDLLTTTTERLKTYFQYHSTNKNIIVLPNIINETLIDENKNFNSDKIILGWFGNGGHYDSLSKINKIILKILDEYNNVYLNVYSDSQLIFDLFDNPKVNKIKYNFNFLEFQKSVGDIDINLAPLSQNYFDLHKSNIRIILPGYKGIPSVASNFAEYMDLGNENVLLCSTDDDWYNNIKSLINDVELRNKIGSSIKNYIQDNLTFSKWSKYKSEIFQKLLNK